MQNEFWNTRYRAAEYAYGTSANDFLKQQRFLPKSKILCLAEGEGRNAVFLAEQGHDVTMIDFSEEGIKKANLLAKQRSVELKTLCLDLSTYVFEKNAWDAIVVIFGHFPALARHQIYSQLYSTLKPNGMLVLEVYSKEQIKHSTGGPKDIDMLCSEAELEEDFKEFENLSVNKLERFINEGVYHKGESSVIQIIASK